MPELNIRTSLEVGFKSTGLPEEFLRFRGKATRDIEITNEFPYEDAQFDVVMLAPAAVTRELVREAHRVLRPAGLLIFCVPEKGRGQAGFDLADLYAIMRDGFNLTKVERTPWWNFWAKVRQIVVCATKKNWKSYKGFARDGSLPFSPFRDRT